MSEVIYVVMVETASGWRPYGDSVFYKNFKDASKARDAATQLGQKAGVLSFIRRSWEY